VVVIGAGVIGLAIAQELSPERQVVVLERHESYGRENSSHNSGVIHAGIYYPRDWLKTRLCIEGNRLLYEWAEQHGVRARRTGKLIIASEEGEAAELELLYESARASGVPEMSMCSAAEVRALEPHVEAVAAVYSGSTGVIDQMELMRSYRTAAEANGALIAFKHTVTSLARTNGGFAIEALDPEGGSFAVEASLLVNSAGLAADRIASLLGYPLDGADNVPRLRQRVVKGRYYDIVAPEKARLVTRPVYPLPHGDRAGLGTHVTVDIDAGVHLGPDTEWLDDGATLDFRSDDTRRDEFVAAARRYLPWLGPEDVAPGQVGYRTKLHDAGGGPADFLIWHDAGYVHLGGIESPGMTASLAIAKRVASSL
jgi:L-2-hydroxyglutarate oxidase LhgO